MPDIPVPEPLGYIGVVLVILGIFLFIAGLGIVNVDKVTIRSGKKTWGLGLFITFIGILFLTPYIRAAIPSTPTNINTATPIIILAETPTPLTVTSTFAPNLTLTPTVNTSETPTATPLDFCPSSVHNCQGFWAQKTAEKETQAFESDCRFNNLLTCSIPVAIFVDGQSISTTGSFSPSRPGTIWVDFNNQQNGSGLALPFTSSLDVNGYNFLEISGTSSQEFAFLIEYKTQVGNQLNVVVTSTHQSFPATSATLTVKIPINYTGLIDELAINFFEKGQSSSFIIESIYLKQ